MTLSHISLAKALDQKTGDPTKKEEFLNAVLAHELSRDEARRVVQLFDRYYNITVDEAVAAVRLYSSSELLKKKRDRIGKEKGREKLSEEMQDLLDLVDSLIEKVDDLLGSQEDQEEIISTPLIERFWLLCNLMERFLRDYVDIPLHSKRGENYLFSLP